MSDWIEHDGSDRPKGVGMDEKVLVRMRDGYEVRDSYRVSFWVGSGRKNSNFYWEPDGPMLASEIAAYRVVTK